MVNFFKKHVWILILIISFLMIPQSLSIQAELTERLIITGVAVDKTGDKYEVLAQVVVPSNSAGTMGGSGKVDFVKAEANTVIECINEIAYLIGKTAGFSHINVIVMGQKLATEDGLLEVIDYFIRDKKVPSTALILIAENKAGDELIKTKKMELNTAVGLQSLFQYKQASMNATMMQLHEFLNNSFNISKSGIINELKIEEETKSSSSSGNSSESSSSGESSQENSQVRIKYNANIYLTKNGKVELIINDENQILGVNFLNPNSREGIISVEHVNDEIFKDATVAIRLREKKTKYKAYFDKEGNPHFDVEIKLNKNEILEIDNKQTTKSMYDSSKIYLTNALKTKIQQKIRSITFSSYENATLHNIDFLNVGNRLYRNNAKKWKKFLSSIENPDEYIKYVNFDVIVNVGENN